MRGVWEGGVRRPIDLKDAVNHAQRKRTAVAEILPQWWFGGKFEVRATPVEDANAHTSLLSGGGKTF